MAGPIETPMLALVYQFLIDSNYSKSAAALIKESKTDLKEQSSNQTIKLTNVYQAYVDANPSVIQTPTPAVEEKPTKSKSKRKAAEPAVEPAVVEQAAEVEEPKKKKAKKAAAVVEPVVEAVAEPTARSSRSKTAAAEADKVEEKPVKKSKTKVKQEEAVEQPIEQPAEPEVKPEKKTKASKTKVKAEPTPEPAAVEEPIKEEKAKKTRVKKEKIVEPVEQPAEVEQPAAEQSFAVPQVHAARLARMAGVTEQKPVDASIKSTTKQSKSNKPFQRIDPTEINTLPEAMHDNSYTVDRAGSYGNAANNILITVKGKRFQHEKTKKKRGNYRGGELDQNVRSIKFD